MPKTRFLLIFLLIPVLGYAGISLTKTMKSTRIHSDAITCISITRDEHGILTMGLDGMIKFWGISRPNKFYKMGVGLKIPKQFLLFNYAFNGEKNLIPFYTQGIIKIFSLNDETLETEQILKMDFQSQLTSIEISKRGHYTAVGYISGHIQVFDNVTGKLSISFLRHRSAVTAMAFSEDENTLISGDDNGKIWTTNLATGKEEIGLLRGTASIIYLASIENGKKIISGSLDNVVRIWDVELKREMKSERALLWNSQMVAVSPDEAFIACLDNDSTIQFIDSKNFTKVSSVSTVSAISSMCFSSEGNYFTIGDIEGTISVWDVTGIESSPKSRIAPEFVMISPLIGKDTRGMRVVELKNETAVEFSGVVGTMVKFDSITINNKRANVAPLTEAERIHYKFEHKYGYKFHLQDTLNYGSMRVLINGYTKSLVAAVENFTITIEKTEEPRKPEQAQFQTHAFIVGISNFNDPAWNLNYAAEDAKLFYRMLNDPRMGALSRNNIKLLLDDEATRETILDELSARMKMTAENDVVFIYFATHGFAEDGEVYYMASNTNPNKLLLSGVRSQDIVDVVERDGKGRKVIMFFDACNSGGTGQKLAVRGGLTNDEINAFYEEIAKEKEFFVTISATDNGEYSKEGKEWGDGHGVFTYYLAMGIKGGANTDFDQYVTLNELYTFVLKNVRQDTQGKQNPKLHYKQSANFPMNVPIAIVVR
ncbi:MAG: caspase family protein [Bacteroidota bacterium]|jgi:WD40 repeat protein